MTAADLMILILVVVSAIFTLMNVRMLRRKEVLEAHVTRLQSYIQARDDEQWCG